MQDTVESVSLEAQGDSFVSLKDVNKIYPNGVQAVYDFNIDIKENEFIVLVGPSGCGKSTTLRMIAGLEDITSGQLWINNSLSNYKASKDRDISMVFQSYALYPQMTVYDNIAFPLRARRYRMPVVNLVLKAWDQVVEALNNPQLLADAYLEACDRQLRYSTVVSYVATKLGICDTAAKIICSYKIKSVTDLDNTGKSGKRLLDEIKERAAQEKQKEMQAIAEKGLTVDDQYQVYANGELQYEMKKLSEEEIRKKVFEAAEILDLGPYLDRRPKELSGGQMQRVALGRAIVRNARLFLMDEPLSNLDAKLRVQMRSEIVRIHEQIGATTIYVTHDQTEAMTMATKIAIMSKGWVQQIGTPQEIYYHPKNIFVATFIGSPAMNIIEGEYQNGTITFANGYSVQMPEAFAAKHDAYYREKIAELEAVLEMDDFKKMHALKLIDKDLFALHSQLEPALVGRALKDVIASAHHVNEECAAKVEALIGKFVENEATLASELAEAHKINARELIVALKEIVSTIGDEHGKEALEALNALAEIESQGMGSKESLTTYTAFVQAVEELIAYASTVDSHILQTKCAALNVAGQVDRTSKQWLLTVRKPLLTFEKIPSSVIGKLHNAQVFNKNEKEEKGTLYYQKPKKEKKKHAVKFNLNSVDVEFVNNLYDVACDLLAKCKAALSGKHGVRLGIRPEDLHLSSEFTGDSTQGFKVNSNIVELLGSELLIHTQWAGATVIAKISTGTLVKPHTEVELTMNREKILVFDENCGDTI